ncbi:T6SS effector phospholipase Tle3 domain-containing protein [Leminorella grimontii]|uniref:T6SS effector phospholipase Tle3 domain-containing protein n=1 Tax=Leminorella grimontii TaxID=82981 RepID=UPI00321FA383
MAKHEGATRKLNTSSNELGQQTSSTSAIPSSVCVTSEISPKTHLPGVIIFVHGVNSEGEWYEDAEQALCDGLNNRLFLKDSCFELKPNIYKGDQKAAAKLKVKTERVLDVAAGEDSYLIEPNNSPVIRFYWGYRAGDELGNHLVPLRNVQGESYQQHLLEGKLSKEEIVKRGPYFWGGGPFQNASTTLNPMWGNFGFSEDIIGGLMSTQWFNPEEDRLLATAPPRKYYAHAAWRLAMLIQRIRDHSPNDTITIVSHSKGTMVALAASLISAPDALFLLNSPYRMMNIMTDYSAVDRSEQVSDGAREETLKAVVEAVAKNQDKLSRCGLEKHLSLGKGKDGRVWTPNSVHRGSDGTDVPERDNHGRTYIYCNAHDRVMGSIALVSIGWQGLPNSKDGKMHPLLEECKGKLFQRLIARWTPCGGEPNVKTNFGSLPDMYTSKTIPPNQELEQPAREVKERNEPFWDDMRYAVEVPVIVAVSLPITGFKLGYAPIWQTPPEWQTMNVNAERVPEPLSGEEMKAFDENNRDKSDGKNEGWGESKVKEGKVTANDEAYRYYLPLYQLKEQNGTNMHTLTLLNTLPEGIDPSPAAEKQRQINRSKGELGIKNGWIVWQHKDYATSYNPQKAGINNGDSVFQYYGYLEFKRDKADKLMKQTDERLKTYISRPTDHSTLPRSHEIMSRVAAFDLPIGFGRCLDETGIKLDLIKQADWTLLGSDFYMEKGVLAQDPQGDALIKQYFSNQTQLSPAMPSTINCSKLTKKELEALVNMGHEVAKDYEEARERGIVYD